MKQQLTSKGFSKRRILGLQSFQNCRMMFTVRCKHSKEEEQRVATLCYCRLKVDRNGSAVHVQQVSRLLPIVEIIVGQGTLPYVSANLVAEDQAKGWRGSEYGNLAWPTRLPECVGVPTGLLRCECDLLGWVGARCLFGPLTTG